MVFNSYFFIFIYLPILLIGWFGLNRVNRRTADVFLIGMSLWFYGCFGWAALTVLLISIGMNYVLGRGIEGRRGRLAAGVIANLVLLAWFKYATDLISSAAEAAGTDTSALPTFLTLAMPVGLSFYTFTQISYLIDRYRGEAAQEAFLSYALYASYFPKLVEGPITRYEEIASQFRDETRRKFCAEHFTRGLILLVLGMGKKVLIADVLSPAVSHGLSSAYYLDTLSVIVTMLGYALQLYMDFSGFCDMAMGISWMLNIDLPLNFDAPLRSTSYTDFWRRWHMTLNRFFTQYIYIPLGGSRRGVARTFRNTVLVFLLSGIWHGTGATYLAWGAVNGVLVFLGSRYRKYTAQKKSSVTADAGASRTAAAGRSSVSAVSALTDAGAAIHANETSASPAATESGGSAGANDDTGRSSLQPTPADSAACRDSGRISRRHMLSDGLRRVRTIALFLLTLILFGASSLNEAFVIFRQLFVPRFPGWLYRMAGQLDTAEFWVINKAVSLLAPQLADPAALAELLLVMLIALVLVLQPRTAVQTARTMKLTPRNAVLIALLAVWCITSMSGVSTYIYFQF